MKRNFLLMLLLTLLPLAGWAQVQSQTVSSAAELKAALTDETTIEVILGEDILVSQAIRITKEVTLDLNGKKITVGGVMSTPNPNDPITHNNVEYPEEPFIVGRGGKFTVTDYSDLKDGEIDASKCMLAIKMTDASDASDNSKTAELVVMAGTIKGETYGISGNGNAGRDNTSVTVNGGKIIATSETDGTGIYNPQDGTVTINGGEITGYSSAIEVRSGNVDVTITAGTLTALAETYSSNPNGNGTTAVGAAFAVAQHVTKKNINIVIEGGEFIGTKSLSIDNPQGNTDANVSVSVTGGKFNGGVVVNDSRVEKPLAGGVYTEAPAEEYVAEGYVIVDNLDYVYRKAIIANRIVSYDWTSTPASVIYTGKAQKPEITVTGTYVAGEEVEIPEYSEGSSEAVNWVARYYTDEECTDEVDEMIDPATYYVKVFVPGETEEFTEEIGTAKTYTIEKKTLYINLAYIYKYYGEPDPEHPTVDNFEFDPKTGEVPADAKQTICQYLVVKRARGYEGNTPGQYHYWYDYSQSYLAGDAPYKIICLQNESNLIINGGILTVTIDPESTTKVFGDPDPEYKFTATNTIGTEVTGVSVTRPEAGTEEGETLGNHPLTVTFDNPEEAGFYTSVVYDPADPQLEITEFDLEKDNDEEGGYGYGKENYQPKFNIEVLPVTYNADTQFPDAKITFFSEALGKTIDLTYEEDGETPKVPFVKKWHEDGDESESGVYTTENYEYMKGASTYEYTLPDASKRKGSYVPNVKTVKRNAETAAVEEGAAIIVTGKGAFINTKQQAYAIQPAKLSVKVKDFTGEWPGAGYNFGIELNTEGANGAWPEKEDAAARQEILNRIGAAVTAYDPDGEYGYDYAGGTGNITVSVIEAAQTALNVVLAASNYELDFAGAAANISDVALAIVPDDQDGTYRVFDGETEVTDLSDYTQIYTYKRPELDQTKYKVMSGSTEVTLPEGAKVTLTTSGTKVGDQNVITATVSDVPANFAISTTATAKFTVAKLDEIHLAYNEVAQLLEDHQGQEGIKVFMPNRNLRNKQWYSMILPFDIDADEFFTAGLGYGAFETLNEDNTSSNPSFKLTIDEVEANTPFIVKVRKNYNKIGNTNAAEGEKYLTEISFENKTIATLPEGFAYNDLDKAPYTEDKNGTKFVGQYTGKTGVAANERWMSKGEFYAGTESTYLDPTAAFLSFKSEQEAKEAIIFIQELDGTYTPINAVKADDDNDANADGIYDLSGRRVNKAQKGIYIQNGKKVLVK